MGHTRQVFLSFKEKIGVNDEACEFLAVRKGWCMSVAWAGWPVGRVSEVCFGMSVTVNIGGASVFGMDCASGGMQGKRRVVGLSEWFYFFVCVFECLCEDVIS